ncbi:sugar transferase [Serinicoccus kebangsaanensis]|uniref:sugar transferase n=1 Tax=Serinicoccus kebangsaanensis TaxID=2602069 RepID=UPI002675B799|nr:sugar transferase [Serinicoccus kebangsaanensis]
MTLRTDSNRSLRILDLAVVGLTAPGWGPLLAGCALLCRVAQGAPVIFTQERAGLHAEPFTAYKFRTMINDADSYLDDSGAPTRQRVTPTGALLRRTGLDELPQIANVIRGDMSLVGPRPVLPSWVDRFPEGASHPRFRTRPGLTGLAQIAGRNTVLWSERLALDTRWSDTASVRLYLSTLLRTPLALLRPTVSADRNAHAVDDLQQPA